MASLLGKFLNVTMQSIMQIANGITGFDGTLRSVQDGNGTSCPLQLSTSTANINGTFKVNGAILTLPANFTLSGAFATILTVTNTTNVTLPTSGTLATLAGSETFTNKTITSPTITGATLTTSTYNGLAITASTGTLTIANAKTLTVNNSITLSGTDSTTMTLPTTSKTLLATDGSNVAAQTFKSAINNVYFEARLTVAQSSVTGDGTQVVIVCDTSSTNIGSAYNATTGIFTAPYTGLYYFEGAIQFTSLNASNTSGFAEFLASTTSYVDNYIFSGNFANLRDAGNSIIVNGNVIIYMTALDTIKLNVGVSNNGTKNVTIGNSYTRFSGYFIG